MSLDRHEYSSRWHDLVDAVQNGSKDECRAQLRYLMGRILSEQDQDAWRRILDDLVVAWRETYRKRGRGSKAVSETERMGEAALNRASFTRHEYIKNFNDLVATVSDGSVEEARGQLRYLVERILSTRDDYYFRRLVDDVMCAWFDTYRWPGKGPWLPREAAGLGREPE